MTGPAQTTAMQQLTCRDCGTTWEREPKRGRPPVQCPDCKAGRPASKPQKKPGAKPGTKTPENSSSPQKPSDSMAGVKVKRKRGKTAYQRLETGLDNGPVDQLPFATRTSGWCTTYHPAPVAVHDRCDGDLGKYRCPCHCHGWEDTP